MLKVSKILKILKISKNCNYFHFKCSPSRIYLITLKISSEVVCDSNDENNFPHKLLLTNTQISGIRTASAKGSSANIKLSKNQLHKIGQSGAFLGRLWGPLLNSGLPLIGNILKPLAKRFLIPLRLTATASATDATIHKKWLDPIIRH